MSGAGPHCGPVCCARPACNHSARQLNPVPTRGRRVTPWLWPGPRRPSIGRPRTPPQCRSRRAPGGRLPSRRLACSAHTRAAPLRAPVVIPAPSSRVRAAPRACGSGLRSAHESASAGDSVWPPTSLRSLVVMRAIRWFTSGTEGSAIVTPLR